MANVNNHIKNIHVIPEMCHVKGCGGFLPSTPITVSPRFSASQRRQQDFGPRNMAARFFASSCSSAKPKSESLPSQPGGKRYRYIHMILFRLVFLVQWLANPPSFHRKDHFERIFTKDHRLQTSSCFLMSVFGWCVGFQDSQKFDWSCIHWKKTSFSPILIRDSCWWSTTLE